MQPAKPSLECSEKEKDSTEDTTDEKYVVPVIVALVRSEILK
jgi:hypothetical protein